MTTIDLPIYDNQALRDLREALSREILSLTLNGQKERAAALEFALFSAQAKIDELESKKTSEKH